MTPASYLHSELNFALIERGIRATGNTPEGAKIRYQARGALRDLVEQVESIEQQERLAKECLEAAEARVAALEARLSFTQRQGGKQIADLEEALREVLGYAENNDERRVNDRFDAIHRIARTALAHSEEKGTLRERVCQRCGRENPVWWVDDDLWNETMGTPDNPRGEGIIICPSCFVRARVSQLEEALRRITQTDWHSEGWSKETPFQFEQRIHKIAADALMSAVLEAKEREDEPPVPDPRLEKRLTTDGSQVVEEKERE